MTSLSPSRWLDGLGLSLVAGSLSVVAAAVVVLPQRLAQRPGSAGVLAVHLDAAGTLRLWNRPITARELLEVLAQRGAEASRSAGVPRSGAAPQGRAVVRLIPDPEVPWGIVQQAASGLEGTGLPLELQLP